MEVKAKDIISSVDLTKSEALLPIYECIVNSIISLNKTNVKDKKIEVFIKRKPTEAKEQDLFDKKPAPIESVTIIDNGEGFNETNFSSFKQPFSQINKKYGCKGVGRFTVLALFRRMEITSIYQENGQWYRRFFAFDAENEISEENCHLLEEPANASFTKVELQDCYNKDIAPATAKNAEDIAKGIMDHCFIYYLCDSLPNINVTEFNAESSKGESLSVENFFKLDAKDKEKVIDVRGESFRLYIVKSTQTTNRKYNYVTFCANSRKVGGKRDLSRIDSLYSYPIADNGEVKYLDVYVVSPYLDKHVNNQRTGFTIPDTNEGTFWADDEDKPISIEDILRSVASEVAEAYAEFAKETKKKNIADVKKYIEECAPQYRSFLYQNDVLESMPPNLSNEKKDEYLHRMAYNANRRIDEKIEQFIQTNEINEEKLTGIVASIREKTAYNSDKLAEYVFRRKAILRLFDKMLDKREDGSYETESMIHNLIFPMGLTNRQLDYQYHNLWLLDDRFSTFRYIGSDKTITSLSQIKSKKEPDLILIDNEQNLVNNAILFGNRESGEIGTMVIFEFKYCCPLNILSKHEN